MNQARSCKEMFAHHARSDTALYSTSAQSRRKKQLQPESSPLLLISTPYRVKEAAYSRNSSVNGISTSQHSADCMEDILGPMEIKELCQSPKSSRRFSMFAFTPSPKSSSEQQQQQQQPEVSQNLNIFTVYPSDDSSQSSSPETTLLRTNKLGISPASSDRRRYMVINELIATETKYIDNLSTILSVFMPAFEHVVAARDLRLLIPAQLEQLVESHQDLLKTLKSRMSQETKFHGFIGDVFSRLCGNSNMEFFNMYRVYMGEFKIAMKTLVSYEADSLQFKEILTLLQQSPLCERLTLASYLLTPIQRLPRYELLLKELLKSTAVDHPDHYYLGEALSRIHKELTRLNLSIKSCQMACPANRKALQSKGSVGRRNIRRRPSRTMSMLKKFVSATNIDDYSSGESSFTTDDIVKLPALRLARRSGRRLGNSPSFTGSDHDLSASLGNDTSGMMFRRGSLTTAHRVNNRAASCSDLLINFEEEGATSDDQHKTQMPNFPLMTPLASENCTPNSSRHSSVDSRHHSYMYSSNSSLSSLDSNRESSTTRDPSLTPTASPSLAPPTFTSTPTTCVEDSSKDSTLKVTDEPDGEGAPEKPCEERTVVQGEEVVACEQKKSNWKMSLFKRRKKSVPKSALKYIKQETS